VPVRLFRLDFDDFYAFVVATRGANLMGQAQLVAVGTWDQIPGLEGVMTASPTLAALAQLVFW
jgi:hypothetical protein